MYKFNNAVGAIVCDGCGKILQNNVTIKEYRDTHTGYDFCEDCLSNLTIVDNFDRIKEIMQFNNSDEFYFVQIIQRKKDGNMTQVGNNGYRTIKTYYIYSIEQLENKKDKIKELCLRNNARAYINVNKRNAKEVALEAIKRYATLIEENNSYQGYRVYDSACGSTKARGYKPYWTVDIDSKDIEYMKQMILFINDCRGAETNKIKYVIPTPHGYHLVTIGFDVTQFLQKLAIHQFDPIDIQKDNPTLLYYAGF